MHSFQFTHDSALQVLQCNVLQTVLLAGGVARPISQSGVCLLRFGFAGVGREATDGSSAFKNSGLF